MANNLKMVRKALGLTQPELAEKMGTTKNQLIKLEKGDRRLTQAWLERAATATGVAIENFVMESFAPSHLVEAARQVESLGRSTKDRSQIAADLFSKLSQERQDRILADIRDAARLEGVESEPPARPRSTE